MTSTHSPALPTRLAASLVELGLRPQSIGLAEHTQDEVQDSFLSHLFPFQHLDFAFVRYPSEMVVVDWDSRIEVFGVCDAGQKPYQISKVDGHYERVSRIT